MTRRKRSPSTIPLVFADGALDLQEQLVVRIVAERAVDEGDGAANALERLEQQPL